MKKNFSPSLALVLLSLFLGNSAAAGGFYLGVHGGLTILEDADLAVDNPGAPTLDLTLKTDRGWLAGAAAGYDGPAAWLWRVNLLTEKMSSTK